MLSLLLGLDSVCGGSLLVSLLGLIPLLVLIGYFMLLERKVMSGIHKRRGPDLNGLSGIIQTIYDGLKLVLKVLVGVKSSHWLMYIIAVGMAVSSTLGLWGLLVVGSRSGLVVEGFEVDEGYGVLGLLGLSSFSVLGVFLAGWCSNNKYSLLGGLRGLAQLVAYDICFGMVVLTMLLFTNSLWLSAFVDTQRYSWHMYSAWPLGMVYCIVALAESHRSPFDLPEAESELISGFNTEYSSVCLALFFIAEYSAMLAVGSLGVVFFFGGFDGQWQWAVVLVGVWYIWVRATLPRYSYDQLLYVC